jgi:hypothetical protein
MINPSPIDLQTAAHCARLIFESMDWSAVTEQDRSHVDPLADSSPCQNTLFLSLNRLLARPDYSQSFVTNTRLITKHQSSLQSP